MPATIALRVPLIGSKFVNSSRGVTARLLEGEPRRGGIQERRTDRFVDRDFVGAASGGNVPEQHLPDFACNGFQPKASVVARKQQVPRLAEGARTRVHVDAGARHQLAWQLT